MPLLAFRPDSNHNYHPACRPRAGQSPSQSGSVSSFAHLHMPRILLIFLGLVALTPATSAGIPAPGDRVPTLPNVVLIYTDDQGYGDASCLNAQSAIQTPNLDQLAREGLSFTDAHCSDTVCTPSRYGLLTGRYSWRTELKRGVFGAERKCLIADGRMTIASMLGQAGYYTAMIGKWHLGMDFPGEPGNRDWTQPVLDMPLDKGFDHFQGIPASLNYGILAWFDGRHAKVPPTLYTNKKPNQIALSDYRIKPPYDQTPEATQERLGTRGMEIAPDFVDSECLTRFTSEAMTLIRSRSQSAKAGKPFFLYLPYTSPHKPVIPIPEFRGRSKAGAYGDFVIETDHHVGQIMKCLREEGIAENTIVIFTSDNGPENTWKQRLEKYAHDSSYIYREGKRSIYEGGHRVPFFVHWPNGIEKPGRVVRRTVCQTDILATLADLVGQEIPDRAGEDSESFLAVLRDKPSKRDAVLISHGSKGRFAARQGHWKLVMKHQRNRMELYDLESDPGEENSVLRQHPDIVKMLTKEATNAVLNGRTTPGTVQPNDTGWWNDLTWVSEQEYTARQP